MASYRYLIIYLVLLLAGCAQVGTISGGDEDIHAPKPIENEVSPENASLFFTAKHVNIPFDEYIKLNSPAQNITIVPPHAKIQSSVKGKTLFLDWEEDLEANTTYAIYMNRAIKDLSEGNDSIMQYVFSTGPTLDSLSYSVSVVDAWTNELKKDVLIALYDPANGSILNFAQTDNSGRAKLRYLKARNYKIIAFEDENGDLKPQDDEAIAFFEDSLIKLDSSYNESLPFRLFTPREEPEIISVNFKAPASLIIEMNQPIEKEVLYLDGTKVEADNYSILEEKTIELFVDSKQLKTGLGEIVYSDESFTDTATYRVVEAQKKGEIRMTLPDNGVFSPSDSVELIFNDIITEVDGKLITIRHEEDSTEFSTFIGHSKNKVTFNFPRNKTSVYLLHFDAGAVKTVNGQSLAFDATVKLNSSKRYGSFSLDLSHYTKSILLQVLRGGKLVDELDLKAPDMVERVIIPELLPGTYTFKVIHDDNYNNQWDVGDLEQRIQPEKVDQFSTPSKIRANWEVEIQLIPNSTTP
ncbi:MAG: hypothetical protein ACI865_000331 [Flavobacteriaceae bacterium]|jgi:hypothetical protein